uniref:Uncharacterized protein n=1 Tax=Rhizophora mucronata TaxID=61149 RepID=A0A2P2QEN7_RHIMU
MCSADLYFTVLWVSCFAPVPH